MVRYNKSKNDLLIELRNGFTYKWVRYTDNDRGHRFDYAIIDATNANADILNSIILPRLCYCKDIKSNVQMIYDGELTIEHLYLLSESFFCLYGKDVKIKSGNEKCGNLHTMYYDTDYKCIFINN